MYRILFDGNWEKTKPTSTKQTVVIKFFGMKHLIKFPLPNNNNYYQ